MITGILSEKTLVIFHAMLKIDIDSIVYDVEKSMNRADNSVAVFSWAGYCECTEFKKDRYWKLQGFSETWEWLPCDSGQKYMCPLYPPSARTAKLRNT